MAAETGKNYYLLLLDIRDSSVLPAKELTLTIQKLEERLRELNRRYRKQLALKLSINYGDEIAALLETAQPVLPIVQEIRNTLYPLTSLRFAVVYGKIAVAGNDIRKAGGPVFKQADERINELKKKNVFSYWQTGHDAQDQALTALCNVSNVLLEEMSGYQREVFALLEQGYNQREIAEELGKYQQSVWDALHRSKALYVQECEKGIGSLLALLK